MPARDDGDMRAPMYPPIMTLVFKSRDPRLELGTASNEVAIEAAIEEMMEALKTVVKGVV